MRERVRDPFHVTNCPRHPSRHRGDYPARSLTKLKTEVGIQEGGASWSLTPRSRGEAQRLGWVTLCALEALRDLSPSAKLDPKILFTPTEVLKQTTTNTNHNSQDPGTVRTLRKPTVTVPFLTSKTSL